MKIDHESAGLARSSLQNQAPDGGRDAIHKSLG